MTVYQKLLTVQSKLKAPKSQYNSFGKYNYRNCEDILEAVKPILSEVGAIILVSDCIEHYDGSYNKNTTNKNGEIVDEITIGFRYVKSIARFINIEDGEEVSVCAYAREATEKKGMDDSQITGATSSYARKYALNGLLLIDDTKDADTMDNSNLLDKVKNVKTVEELEKLYNSNKNAGTEFTKAVKEKKSLLSNSK